MNLYIFLLNLGLKICVLKRTLNSVTSNLLMPFLRVSTTVMAILVTAAILRAGDYYVTGTVTDISGKAVPGAKISMTAGSSVFGAMSDTYGNYSLRIFGIYGPVPDLLQLGVPYPNPFT